MAPGQQSLEAVLHDTATTFLKVFETLDTSVVRSIQSDSYTHHFAPASLAMPEQNLKQFIDHIKWLNDVLKAFPVIPKEIWVNPTLKQVTIWATAVPEFHQHIIGSDDSKDWYVQGEYIFVLSMDDSGRKIERGIEFLDSKRTEYLLELNARARSRLAEDSSK